MIEYACPTCHRENHPAARTCPWCGAPLPPPGDRTPTTPPPGAAQAQAPAPPPGPAQAVRPRPRRRALIIGAAVAAVAVGSTLAVLASLGVLGRPADTLGAVRGDQPALERAPERRWELGGPALGLGEDAVITVVGLAPDGATTAVTAGSRTGTELLGITTKTGEIAWRTAVDGDCGVPTRLKVGDTVVCEGPEATLRSLAITTGEETARTTLGRDHLERLPPEQRAQSLALANPVVLTTPSGRTRLETIYFAPTTPAATGVIAVQAWDRDGTPVWSGEFATGKSPLHPMATDDLLLFPGSARPDDQGIIALDIETGTPVGGIAPGAYTWLDRHLVGAATFTGDGVLLAGAQPRGIPGGPRGRTQLGGVVAYDRTPPYFFSCHTGQDDCQALTRATDREGQRHWSAPASSVWAYCGEVFVGLGGQQETRLNAVDRDGRELWHRIAPVQALACRRDQILAHEPGRIQALDPATGTPVWSVGVPTRSYQAIQLRDGILVSSPGGSPDQLWLYAR